MKVEEPGRAGLLARVNAQLERGCYLAAYRALVGARRNPARAERQTARESWAASGTTRERLLLGRLVRQLGAPRLGTAMLTHAWRRDPHDPEACYLRARDLLALRGPAAALDLLQRRGDLEDAPPELIADWLSLRGIALARLGDPVAGHSWQERARRLAPHSAWLAVERSHLLELEDRFAEAAVEALRAVELAPRSRSALLQCAALHLAAGEPRRACQTLVGQVAEMESADLLVQLARAHTELGQHAEALATLRRARTLLPLAEPAQSRWLDGLESDAAYLAGDRKTALRLARRCGTEEHQGLAQAMARSASATFGTPGSRRSLPADRVALNVPNVRQRRLGCAPAAVAMLFGHLGHDADADAIAAAVCGELGTANHVLRAWLEGQGWLVRELTVDVAASIALIDRGLPFALTSLDQDSAHMQVVRGYDCCRQTLLVRDPARPEKSEIRWQELFARGRPPGPRGLLTAPRRNAGQLASLQLPEAGLYDCLHGVQRALHEGGLEEARQLSGRLAARAPGHPIDILARSSLAAAEQDPARVVDCLQEMLAGYPEQASGILRRLERLLPRRPATRRRIR